MLCNESPPKERPPSPSPDNKVVRSRTERLVYLIGQLNPANWFNDFRDIKITMDESFLTDRFQED